MNWRRHERTPWRSLWRRTGTRLDVPVSSCVHYCGFLYGGADYHPYESYQRAVVAGESITAARRQFISFLQHYRPRHFADALGITLERPHALWIYPWNTEHPGPLETHGWRPSPDQCPDILTHFSPEGILSFRIDEEFVWLERIVRALASRGYRPDEAELARVLELKRRDGVSVYLVEDGNHRAGALAALRCSSTIAVERTGVVREDEVDDWPGVRSGWISRADALALFGAYFTGDPAWRRSLEPAPIIGPPEWLELYFGKGMAETQGR